MFVLVAYDIRDDERLRRVAKVMESYGHRVQRSIFECEVGTETLIVMIAELKAAMHRREDKGVCLPTLRQLSQTHQSERQAPADAVG